MKDLDTMTLEQLRAEVARLQAATGVPLYGELVVDAQRPDGSWVEAGRVRAGDPPGSMSDHSSGRREVLLFYCLGDRSEVRRSKGGADAEVGDCGATRLVVVTGEDVVFTLRAGDEWLHAFRTDRDPSLPLRVRLRHVGPGRPN